MNTQRKNQYLLVGICVALLILLGSCETPLDDDLDLNSYRSELVLNGAFAAGVQPQIRLTLSQPSLQVSNFVRISSALVEVETPTGIQTMQAIGDGYFEGDFEVQTGFEYNITAATDGLDAVSASAQVPSQVSVHSFENIDSLFILQFGGITSRLSFTIHDNADETNFYEVILYQFRESGEVVLMPIRTANPSVENAGAADIIGTRSTDYIQKFLLTDRLFNGESFRLELDYLWFDSELPVTVHIKSLSADYYRFLDTSYTASEGKTNPFAEPISIVGNIQNGQGIFGGYTLHEHVLE